MITIYDCYAVRTRGRIYLQWQLEHRRHARHVQRGRYFFFSFLGNCYGFAMPLPNQAQRGLASHTSVLQPIQFQCRQYNSTIFLNNILSNIKLFNLYTKLSSLLISLKIFSKEFLLEATISSKIIINLLLLLLLLPFLLTFYILLLRFLFSINNYF